MFILFFIFWSLFFVFISPTSWMFRICIISFFPTSCMFKDPSVLVSYLLVICCDSLIHCLSFLGMASFSTKSYARPSPGGEWTVEARGPRNSADGRGGLPRMRQAGIQKTWTKNMVQTHPKHTKTHLKHGKIWQNMVKTRPKTFINLRKYCNIEPRNKGFIWGGETIF